MNREQQLAKNTLLLSIGTLLTNVLQFVMVPIFSSWLTTAEYGTFDLCVTYVSLMLPIINLASGEAVFRYSLDVDHADKKKFISDGLAIVAINSFITSIVLSIIAIVLNKMILFPFLALLLGQVFNSYCQSFLRGIKKLPIYSVGNIITTIFISAFVTLFILCFRMGLYGIVIGYAIGYFAGDIFILMISRYWQYFSFNLISLRGMLYLIKYSYPLIPNNICWWIINVSDRLIINKILGASFNGIYAISNKVPNVCASVFGMFNISWQESASETVASADRNKYFNKIYNSTIAILISLCTGVLSLNWFLYDYIFDSKYSDARLYMPILVVAIVFNSLSQFYGGIMISLKRPKANGITTLLGAIVNAAVHIGLVYFIGLYAAAISTAVSNLALCIFRRFNLRYDVVCKPNKSTLLYAVFFVYMFIIAYIDVDVYVRITNLFFSCALFAYINRVMLIKVFTKIINYRR